MQLSNQMSDLIKFKKEAQSSRRYFGILISIHPELPVSHAEFFSPTLDKHKKVDEKELTL